MDEHYAIKRPGGWFWTGKLTREQAVEEARGGRLPGDWLICPLGSANKAITVATFLGDPGVLDRREKQEIDQELRRRAFAKSYPWPRLLKAGAWMLQTHVACLIIGGATVKIFFPQLQGGGIPPAMYAVLIPIWTLGGLGLLFAIIGWIQRGARIRRDWRIQLQAESTGRPAMASN